MSEELRPEFRPSNEDEIKVIKNFLKKNFGFSIKKLMENSSFYTKAGKVKEIYLVPKNVSKYIEKISTTAYCAGIPFGSIWGRNFQLEIEGSRLLLPYINKIIKVKTDQFLYGKSIFVENIVQTFGEFNKGDYVIIVGKNNLHYGIGKILYSSKELMKLKHNTVVIRGYKDKPFDRGWYLRRGG